MYMIDEQTLLAAAILKYGEDVKVTAPYWVNGDCVRVGVAIGDVSFGANFDFVKGEFL